MVPVRLDEVSGRGEITLIPLYCRRGSSRHARRSLAPLPAIALRVLHASDGSEFHKCHLDDFDMRLRLSRRGRDIARSRCGGRSGGLWDFSCGVRMDEGEGGFYHAIPLKKKLGSRLLLHVWPCEEERKNDTKKTLKWK